MEYTRRIGVADQKGTQFEIKMNTLLFLRALQTSQPFKLAVNVDSIVSFDDIVLRIRNGDDDLEILIQLKHHGRSIGLSATEGKFALKKYLSSFKKIGSDNTGDIQRYFVLFTNAEVRLGSATPIFDINPFVKNLLNTGGDRACVFQISVNDKICKPFRKDPDASNFMDSLIVFSCQAGVQYLGEMIKQEIKRIFPYSRETSTLHKTLVEKMEAYWELTGTTPCLTENWKVWKTVESLHQSPKTLLSKIRFSDDIVAELVKRITDSKCHFIQVIYKDVSVELASLKMHQVLLQECVPQFLFNSVNDDGDALEIVMALFNNGWRNFVVLEHFDVDISKNMKEIVENLTLRYGCKILFLSSIQIDVQQFDIYQFTDSVTFDQLDSDSKNLVLDTKVIFQGKEIKLRSLDLVPILNGRILSKLVGNTNHRFAQPLPKYNQIYIQRTLSKKIPLRKEMLTMYVSSEIFYICDETGQELKEIIANKSKDDHKLGGKENCYRFVDREELYKLAFQEECLEDGCPVHFLEIENDVVYWIASHGSTKNLRRYVDTSPKELEDNRKIIDSCRTYQCKEAHLVESDLKTVIVTGNPGIGKTVLFSNTATRLKDLYPSYWVINVNLSDYSNMFYNMHPRDITPETVMQVLATSAGIQNSELEKELLVYAMNQVGNVCILCDSFDEIGPKYTEIVLAILRIIQQLRMRTLWVASRQVVVEKLESELSSKAFTLLPFKDSEELDFFADCWGEDRARKILTMVHKKFRVDNGVPISSFPLHMMMLREAFNELVLSDNFTEISRILNAYDLYETFIDSKLKLYYAEKAKIREAEAESDYIKEILRKEFIQRHMIYSLVVLDIVADLDEIQQASIKEKLAKYKQDVEKGKDKTGIIDGVVDGIPRFIHRTFAEYFAAQWLAKHMQNILPYIRKTIFNAELNIVYEVFSRILAKGCLVHLCVLNGDVKELKELLHENMNCEDAGGRTALHLAAQNFGRQTQTLIKMLVDHGVNINKVDHLLELTPIYYAARSNAWKVVPVLLRNGANVTINVGTCQEVVKFISNLSEKGQDYSEYLKLGFEIDWCVFDGNTILHLSIRHNDLNCARICLENGVDVNIVNVDGQTSLFLAIKYRRLDLIHLLISRGANTSSVTTKGESALHIAAYGKDLNVFKLLVELGASITDVDHDGNSLLHLTYVLEHLELVELLLKHGADLNKRNKDGNTPLHMCDSGGMSWNVVRMLLQHEASVEAVNKNGNTPLHMACKTALNVVTVKLLFRHGANVHATNRDGDTPLHIAAGCKNANMKLKMLLEEGASVTAANNDGLTPLDVAVRNRCDESVVTLLQEHRRI